MPVLARDGIATRTLVIAASPSLAVPVEMVSRQFEATHPDVRVRIYYDSGLALRQTIATMENRGRYFIGTGPIHLLAPGGTNSLPACNTGIMGLTFQSIG